MRVVYRISLWHGTARETGIVIPCWVYSCYTLYTGRWNGYNPDEHITIVDEYNKLELAKRQLKADKLQQELLSGQLSEDTVRKVCLHVCVCVCVCLWFTSLLLQDGDSDDSDHDEDKYADEIDMPGTKFDSKTRTTVRNLRIREDTAKYTALLTWHYPLTKDETLPIFLGR